VGASRGHFGAQLLLVGLVGLLTISLLGLAGTLALGPTLADDSTTAFHPLEPMGGSGVQPVLTAAIQSVQSRWFGRPTIWIPPSVADTELRYFEVTGRTQKALLASIKAADICKTGCLPDPAVPSGGIYEGLEGLVPSSDVVYCYSPRTATFTFRHWILLPHWRPAIASVSVDLVVAWNELLKLIYTHEAGHVTVAITSEAALTAKSHLLPNCQAWVAFWADPHVWDQANADQNAYHARLRADCRPEIGCQPPGWMGW
jgi:hypothetical protein